MKDLNTVSQLSERELRLIFELMPNGFALYEMIYNADNQPVDFRYLEMNPAFEKLTGLHISDVIGRTVKEVLPETEVSLIRKYNEIATGGGPQSFESHSKDLGKDYLVYSFSPEKGRFATIFSDISAIKRAESQIRKLSEAVKQSPASIVITDLEGTIEYVNPRFVEETGYTLEEAVGQNPKVLKSGEQSDLYYKHMWETITSGNIWTGEFHNKKKNGELYWEAAVIAPIKDENGVVTNYLAVKEDISAMKMLQSALEKAKIKAEESERIKAAFLANMSHEIRTPMNGILGFVDLLKDPNLSYEDKIEYVTIIEESGHRMLTIINDLINISKVESGQMQVNLADSNINDQIRFIQNFFKLEASKKGLELVTSCPLESDLSIIKTDREKVYAVLTNLIKNAIKFTAKGTITIGYVIKDNRMEFYVKDTGRGIPSDKLTAVFDRFQQVDTELSNGLEGSGLGLTISKAYIEMLGGKIWVDSLVGEGSTFYFTLPYNPQLENNRPYDLIEPEPSICMLPEKVTLLIVDNDDQERKYLKELLKKYNVRILSAMTCLEALEKCKSNPEINLVLMDLKMPIMNGYTATKQIKELRPSLPIIAVTSLTIDSEQYSDVFDEIIIKPLLSERCLQIVEKYLWDKLNEA
ncbi:MAG: PAS domain S-box protein [Bacteroidales bacterium]|nr:PAS domain S-box protein [Bacteroidales bacterium]